MMVNGLYVVQGEANAVVALLKKAHRGWNYQALHPSISDDNDPLVRNFSDLRDVLNSVTDLSEMNPDTFVSPFLDVIKSDVTNGPVTARSMSAVKKFIDYDLLGSNGIRVSNAVENIANAVTKARFVGADAGSDECVLLEILKLLRTLLLAPCGRFLSNESVCEMMQSCFRISFESTLSELLRKVAESTLADMTQLLFTRLPTFKQDIRHPYIRKLIMKTHGEGGRRKRRYYHRKLKVSETDRTESPIENQVVPSQDMPKDMQEEHLTIQSESNVDQHEVEEKTADNGEKVVEEKNDMPIPSPPPPASGQDLDEGEMPDNENSSSDDEGEESSKNRRISNRRSSTRKDSIASDQSFLAEPAFETVPTSTNTQHIPYGIPCTRELLRFLIALSNPLDRANTEPMILMALNLLTVALEAGADYLANYPLLLPLIKNEFCRSLLQLLDTEKLPIFAAANRVCFLLFEALRTNLKFQLESYFLKLKSIVTSDITKVIYEQKEMALESIVQLWRIPGLITELYLNYDCNLYCSNLFEDLTKLLKENAFPVAGLFSTHILSLDALLTVVETIESNYINRQTGALAITQQENEPETGEISQTISQVRSNRIPVSETVLDRAEIINRKKQKRIITEGTDIFNQHPSKGIEFLREKGILKTPLDPDDMVSWLRGNPRLDKKRIADYICSRKNAQVLNAFVQSFPFENIRLDEALRMFLETFRLPGEAAEISMVMQHFSEHWYKANNEPFNHVDAAFTLAYAVIMLNTDQHNPQVRRNQPPMTVDCFKRNLSGTNGGEHFNQEMLEQIYYAIKNDEIVMPAEQTGIVKENYLWKVLLRRGETNEGSFLHAPIGWNDHDLFAIIWGSTTAALSFVFDKSDDDAILTKALNGYRKCAAIAAYYGMSDVFDNLIIHLCKFSTLMTSNEESTEQLQSPRASPSGKHSTYQVPENIAFAFAENKKAQMAAKAMFQLVHSHGDILREGWRYVFDCILHLFHAHLLPKSMIEVEDFVNSTGAISIQRQYNKTKAETKESGLLSWLGLGSSVTDFSTPRRPTTEQEQLRKIALTVIADCHPEQIVTDAKYLTSSALAELINSIVQASTNVYVQNENPTVPSTTHEEQVKKLSEMNEDAIILFLELMISISLENKDRLSLIWPVVKRHLQWLLSEFGKNPSIVERAVIGLLRVANRTLFRVKDDIAEEILHSLSLLLIHTTRHCATMPMLI